MDGYVAPGHPPHTKEHERHQVLTVKILIWMFIGVIGVTPNAPDPE